MSKTHKLILDKLDKYPADVKQLAVRALEIAESIPESSVVERLKGVIRNIVRSEDGDK